MELMPESASASFFFCLWDNACSGSSIWSLFSSRYLTAIVAGQQYIWTLVSVVAD